MELEAFRHAAETLYDAAADIAEGVAEAAAAEIEADPAALSERAQRMQAAGRDLAALGVAIEVLSGRVAKPAA
jgi:hypothetical protein